MKRPLTSLVLILTITSVAWTDDTPVDPLRVPLNKAWAAYRSEVDKVDQAILEGFDKAEAKARQKGEKATLDQLKLDRVDFMLTGVVPKATPVALQQKLVVARRALETAHGQAIKSFTKANKDGMAAAVEKDLKDFRNRDGVRYYTVANEKSGLVLTPGNVKAERGSRLVQAKDTGEPYQQWSFVPTKTSGVYLIKNKLSELYVNISGSHDIGTGAALWSFDAAEHNHWLITRDDKFFHIRDANGDGYLDLAETVADEEDRPVIKGGQRDEKEQCWRVMPVKPK